MAEYQSVFKRYELKYRLRGDTYTKFLDAISDYMYSDSYGRTTICNIYFDSDDYRLIRMSIEKPVYKEKLRLRTYGVPCGESKAFAELKKKYKGVVYKRRICLPYSQAYDWLVNGSQAPESQVSKEIQRFIDFYGGLKPKTALFYDRTSYVGNSDPQLRLTIDENVRFRSCNTDLTNGDEGISLFDDNEYVMEIKIHGAMPIWLSNILDNLKIYPESCSKYGTAYTTMFKSNFTKGATLNV